MRNLSDELNPGFIVAAETDDRGWAVQPQSSSKGATTMDKRVLNGGGKVGALAAAFLLGSVSLGNVFAQQPPQTPPITQPAQPGQQTRQPGYTGTIPAPPRSPGQSEPDRGAQRGQQHALSQ